jgi:hypothetical protein
MRTRSAGRRAPGIGAMGEMSEGTSRVDYCIDRSDIRKP